MIRQVDLEDWQRLRDVRLRALAADPDAFLATLEHESQLPAEEWQRRAAPTDSNASFVVEQNGRFEGLVSCFVADGAAGVVLVAMWVSPELRGSGVARGLVEQVVDWSRARGSPRVTLSVEGHNQRAARLYEKCGFVETTEQPELPYVPNEGNRFYVLEL